MTDTTEDLPPTWNNFTTSSHLSAKTKERIAREVLVIRHHWPQDWQDQLRAGDINIQDQPSFHLAITLAQLSGFEPNIIRLLATLPDFRAFQEAQAPVSGKQVNPRTSTLFGTAKQRIEYTSYRFLEAWLDYLKPPVLPTSVETSRSKRAAARKATKRDAPSPPANTTRRRRTRTSVALVEVGRSGETNDTAAGRSSPGVSEAEDQSIFANSEIEEPGVQLTFDEELTITSALNTANTYTLQHPFNMSQATADMLEDPILRELARLLLEAKERDRALKQGRCDAARQKIESDPTIEVEGKIELLDESYGETGRGSHRGGEAARVPLSSSSRVPTPG
ncbi:hypothetical protein N0V86_007555 [Didymella sp. IMI 355093]|nr:hypothetical protein N0V86_007555 [Didymella sp. IMI 355093]